MFKRMCKAMLKEENYMDALAYLCTKLEEAQEKGKDLHEVWHKMDEKLWNLAVSSDAYDATDNALRISSALLIAIETH